MRLFDSFRRHPRGQEGQQTAIAPLVNMVDIRQDINAAVSELARVLKPGGMIAMAEPNESNLAVRFSRFIEDLPLLRTWVLHEGWDTPNRTINKHKQYVEALAQHGTHIFSRQKD